jgi:fatty-acyl-CoA synthase
MGGLRFGMADRVLRESYWAADTSEPIFETTVGGLLRDVAAAVPDRVALVSGVPGESPRRRWTYAELLADAERCARSLLEWFAPGDRVAVWAPNVPEWIILEMGTALAGVVLVTVNPAYRPSELAYVLNQSGAAGIFLTREFRGNPMAASLEEVLADVPALEHSVVLGEEWDAFLHVGDAAARGSLPDVTPDDIAQIQYTSGTTGFPKGARLRHRGIVNNARLCAQRFEVRDGDVWINPMPLFHTGGCVLGALGSVWARATHIPILLFDPAMVLELVESERGNVMGGVPTMLIALMEHPDFATRDLSSLRSVLSGGSTVPADLVRRIESTLGVRFGIVYGQTESSPVITQTRLDDSADDKALTIGQPLPQTEVKIVEPAPAFGSGAPVPVGVVGELCTRGYLVMEGYNDNPAATAEAIDGDGWLHTGDLCSMDRRGYCTVEGRLMDMIIRGGENLYPREIEELLFTHPSVADVAVVGIPDDRWGEIVGAFVRRSGDVSEAELRSFVRERLAPQKAPERWWFVDEFPLTPSGKVQKFVLRERAVKGELD